jgi:hypothetical protein
MAIMMWCFCAAAAQEKGQFMKIVMHQQIVKLPLCILENTMPCQKVPGLSFEAAMRHHSAAQGLTVNHHFYLGAVRRLRDALRSNDQEMGFVAWQISVHPWTWLNLCSRCWPNTKFSRWVCHKTPLTMLQASLYFSYLNTLRGETFEGEE